MHRTRILFILGWCIAVGGLCPGMWADEATAPRGREYHVAVAGDDSHAGTSAKPLRTIQAAADRAMPGDVITVHEGEYRERINPRRGGTSNENRITYQAAPGEKVIIKGSERVKGWEKVRHDTWTITLPDRFFGEFNPYKKVIAGDWFNPMGRVHHLGIVYLNGHWLAETVSLEEVMKPAGETPLWYTPHGDQAEAAKTTIYAQLPGVDPNEDGIEINVREAVFYPEKPGINYITVRGFTLEHASPNWAPPTAEQMGLIGTHWSKGWVIEDNTIRYSICTGVTLGKYGDEWDNRAQSAKGYVGTINRALANGWSKQNIGGHVVRNNRISHCEQAGLVGSMGAVFSEVTGNTIHEINMRGLFGGAEMAGIKLHAAIDTHISRNHIYRTSRGIWLDWMAQGTRVTRNLLHDNGTGMDLFVEVNHGPFLIDHNLFLSSHGMWDMSQGGAYAHNLFAGRFRINPELRRETPYHPAHATNIAGLKNITGGDNRFLNNLFVNQPDLSPYDKAANPMHMAGNVYLGGAKPSKHESNALVQPQNDPGMQLIQKPDGIYLTIKRDDAWSQQQRPLVTTGLLGKAKVPDLPYVKPDGTAYRIDTDYLGQRRDTDNPCPGPFAWPDRQRSQWKVWPLDQ